MGPSSAVDLSRIRRLFLFKKKRNFVQKIGHGYGNWCHKVGKFAHKHETGVGIAITAYVGIKLVQIFGNNSSTPTVHISTDNKDIYNDIVDVEAK